MNTTHSTRPRSTSWETIDRSGSLLVQRKCSCGKKAGTSSRCEECDKKARFQTKSLRLSSPSDALEREADSHADLVMRNEGHGAVSLPGPGVTPVDPGRIQRQADEGIRSDGAEGAAESEQEPLSADDQEKQLDTASETIESNPGEDGAGTETVEELPATDLEEETVFAKAASGGERCGVRDPSLPSGSGAPLPSGERQQLESHFGHDFSRVKIHDDSTSHRFTSGLGALAATHRNHIYFASGARSSGGMRLLAHEMTHVVQQASAPTLGRSGSRRRERLGHGEDRPCGSALR